MAGKSVTFTFTGPKAEEAAEALWVQYLDGGLDQEIEARLAQNGIEDTDYTWVDDTRIVVISTKQ